MVNNFEQIRKLLEFRSSDDFYFLQIIQRKKDNKEGMKVEGANNNSRLIKYYCIHSLSYLDRKEDEIKQLCHLFNARAGINLNRRSYKKMALQHLKKVTDQIINKDYSHSYKAYPSVLGAYSNETDKKWILDIDNTDKIPEDLVGMLWEFEPYGDKYITQLPTKNGIHVITSPFNLQKFRSYYPDIEVHKNNPVNLYIP